MEKKNTLLLTVIAIATLLVAVVGATYAYFASNIDLNNNLPVEVNTAAGAGFFTALAGDGIRFNVTAAEMLEANANNQAVNIAEGESDSSTISAKLKSSTDGDEVSCKYDIVWVWASGSSYTPSDNIGTAGGKELTIQLYEGTTAPGVGEELTLSETNMNLLEAYPDSDEVTGAKTLATDIEISSDDADEGTTVVHTAKMLFYNLKVDQGAKTNTHSQLAKTYAGNIRIVNVRC